MKIKDSKIPWIGNIPSSWSIAQLSSIFKEHKDKNKLLEENNLLSLSYGKIIRKDINTKEGLLPRSFDGYNIIQKDDIVFRLTDLQNDKRSLRTGLCKERGIITSAYITIRKTQELHSEFFHYLLHSYDECKVFYGLGDGVRQGMTFDDLRKLLLPVPPFQTQQAIANFLDDKCADIDKLITLQQQMIDELKAYKQSVITEAVCKGLDKSVPMKDSGIEWIGEVPESWEILPYKQIMKKKKIIKEKYEGEDIISLTMNGVIVRDLINPKGKMPATFDGYQVVYKNNLLLCLFDIDVTPRCIGLIQSDGLTSPAYSQFEIFDGSNSNYFDYQLRFIDDIKAFLHLSKNLRNSLTENDFGAILTIRPTVDEQNKIVLYLDKKTSQINTLISIKQQKIDELKEYKKSMIYEYITGKKQVPN